MLVVEIAAGIVLAVFVLLFMAYWLWAGLTGHDGAGACSAIALVAGAWFFSTAVGIAATGLMVALFALIVLRRFVDSLDKRTPEEMIRDYADGR